MCGAPSNVKRRTRFHSYNYTYLNVPSCSVGATQRSTTKKKMGVHTTRNRIEARARRRTQPYPHVLPSPIGRRGGPGVGPGHTRDAVRQRSGREGRSPRRQDRLDVPGVPPRPSPHTPVLSAYVCILVTCTPHLREVHEPAPARAFCDSDGAVYHRMNLLSLKYTLKLMYLPAALSWWPWSTGIGGAASFSALEQHGFVLRIPTPVA